MPLKCGKENIGKNIRMLRHEGRKQSQAVAIAMSFSRRCSNSNTRHVRGIKACIINKIARSKIHTSKQARKVFSNAVKMCK
jgi:hypothetical protein